MDVFLSRHGTDSLVQMLQKCLLACVSWKAITLPALCSVHTGTIHSTLITSSPNHSSQNELDHSSLVNKLACVAGWRSLQYIFDLPNPARHCNAADKTLDGIFVFLTLICQIRIIQTSSCVHSIYLTVFSFPQLFPIEDVQRRLRCRKRCSNVLCALNVLFHTIKVMS